MMVSKEEMVDVLKTAAVSRFFLFNPVCILLLGSPAGLIMVWYGMVWYALAM